MKTMLKKFMAGYLNNAWISFGTAILIIIIFFVLQSFVKGQASTILAETSFYLLAASLFGIVVTALICFIKKRWLQGFIRLFSLAVAIVITIFVAFIYIFTGMTISSDDGFADKLTIPKNIKISEPADSHCNIEVLDSSSPPVKDKFQCYLKKSLEIAGTDDSIIRADVPSLFSLHKNHPKLLEHYLACSPAWRVFEEHGNRYATRRWIVGSHWQYELHGYYSNFDKGFQSRTTLGLSSNAWANRSQLLKTGRLCRVNISEGNSMDESHCTFDKNGLVVELFEQSKKPERRLTKAALTFMEDEFRTLAASPHWKTIEENISPIMSPPAKVKPVN
jgi:hypothetical protein